MVTFVDLGPRSTVHLFLSVPVTRTSESWSWGELPGFTGALAREYAYTAHECQSVVHAYGRLAGVILQRKNQERFTITARGPITGRMLGTREWKWSSSAHAYEPAGEYLCGWRSALRAYFDLTGELFDSASGFRANPVGLPMVLQEPGATSHLAHAA